MGWKILWVIVVLLDFIFMIIGGGFLISFITTLPLWAGTLIYIGITIALLFFVIYTN